ncbi:hypothetical protein O1611_g6327 [Lasiodiplodia mahajangana]|uniref:Uncharacterized protein n=1 Tax=Lasiodiplodia mahajangana TaxID=1108764 RepID=A0ACC2JIW7_9PEZI|nr:hypothetical protein O1611_g6327 [Lasiodiplodia mahajangana]
MSNTNKRPKHCRRGFPPTEVPPLMPDINGTYPEVVAVQNGTIASSSPLFDDSSRIHEYTGSTDAVDLEKQSHFRESTSHEHVRLSWVRENLRSISGSIRSSACVEIRSLLSRLSSRASRWSRFEALTPAADSFLSALQGLSTDDANTSIIRLCCRPSKMRGETCLHRKFLVAVQGDTIGPELMSNGLDAQCFTNGGGRDVWNQTVLHLAAKWAPNEVALPLLSEFIDKCPNPSTILNIKNIEGRTFMHIVAERWYCLVSQPGIITLASFCSQAARAGYIFILPDSNGRTFFECFLRAFESPEIVNSWNDYQVDECLQSFLELPSNVEFHQITAMIKPILVIEPWVWVFNDLTTVLRRKMTIQATHEIEEVRPPSIENEFHILLRSERPEPENIHRLCCDVTSLNRPSVNDLNGYNSEGKTCVMALIEMTTTGGLDWCDGRFLDTFLEYGADLQLVDRDGNTALHYAVRAQLPMVASRLIDHGVDITVPNLRGETPLVIAAMHLHSRSILQEAGEAGTRYARAQSMLVRLFKDAFRKRDQDKRSQTIVQMWDLLRKSELEFYKRIPSISELEYNHQVAEVEDNPVISELSGNSLRSERPSFLGWPSPPPATRPRLTFYGADGVVFG